MRPLTGSRPLFVAVLFLFVIVQVAFSQTQTPTALETLGGSVLHFEPGSTPGTFVAATPDYSLQLAPGEITVSHPGEKPITLRLLGAQKTELRAAETLPGKLNYFIGPDRSQWRTNVPIISAVEQKDVYPGIDIRYYARGAQLEFDFTVHKGTDPSQLRFGFNTVQHISVDSSGALQIGEARAALKVALPRVYQLIDGKQIERSARFELSGDVASLRVARFNPAFDLVVDPAVAWSTTVTGGTSTAGSTQITLSRIFVASDANIVIAGDAPLLPTTGGALQTSGTAFAAKLTADGKSLVYATYFGGVSNILPPAPGLSDAAIDPQGNVYLLGTAGSTTPITPNAFSDPACTTGCAYLAKLSNDGSSVIYVAHVVPGLLAVDSNGAAYVAMGTGSTELRAFSLSADGSTLRYSTTYAQLASGNARTTGAAVDSSGNLYVAGTTTEQLPTTAGAFQQTLSGNSDAYVVKLDNSGNVAFLTLLGGSSDEQLSTDGPRIAITATGDPVIAGVTESMDFPTTPGAFQRSVIKAKPLNTSIYVSKLSAAGDQLLASTYLAGSGSDGIFTVSGDGGPMISVAPDGSILLAAGTGSGDFPFANPLMNGANFVQATNTNNGSFYCTLAVRLSASLDQLPFSSCTFFVASQHGLGNGSIVGDRSGFIYLAGIGTPFTTPGAFNEANPYIPGDRLEVRAISILAISPVNSASFAAQHTTTDLGFTSGGTGFLDRITNPGSQPLHIANIATSGFISNFRGASNTGLPCGATLDVGATCYFNYDVSFTTLGPQTATITFTDDAPGTPHVLTYKASAIGPGQPAIVLTSGSINFGSQSQGVRSAPATFTIIAGGACCGGSMPPVQALSILINGPGFSQTNNCPSNIPGNGSCTVQVFFTPQGIGPASGSIALQHDGLPAPTNAISLSGLGIPLLPVTISPSNLAFGTQAVGTTSAAKTVTFTNDGSTSVTFNSVTVSGDFARTTSCFGGLASHASCTIDVTFTPTASGARTGTLTINDNGIGAPHTIALSGNTSDFFFSIPSTGSASSIITAGQSATMPLTLNSAGIEGSASLSCTVSPSGPSCAISPASVTLSSTTPATVNVQLTTTAATTGALHPFAPWLPVSTFGLLLGGMAFAGSHKRLAASLLFILVLSGLVLATSCGGGGGSTASTPPPTPPTGGGGGSSAPQVTQPGIYNVTVTATSGSASHTANLTLIVK